MVEDKAKKTEKSKWRVNAAYCWQHGVATQTTVLLIVATWEP
jgi:hypothetical protein